MLLNNLDKYGYNCEFVKNIRSPTEAPRPHLELD